MVGIPLCIPLIILPEVHFFPPKKTFSLFFVHEQIFTHNVESNGPFHKATHGLSRSSAQWSRTCARDKKGRTPSPVGGNGRNGVATEPLYFADFGFLAGVGRGWTWGGGSISNATCQSANTPLMYVNKSGLDISFLKNVGAGRQLFGGTWGKTCE